MSIFQIILLVLGIIPILISRLGFRTSMRVGYRLGFILFVTIFFLFSLFPSLAQFFAEKVQVGRGADLIFYLTSFGFICFVLIVIIKLEKIRQDITILTRRLAISELKSKNDFKNI